MRPEPPPTRRNAYRRMFGILILVVLLALAILSLVGMIGLRAVA